MSGPAVRPALLAAAVDGELKRSEQVLRELFDDRFNFYMRDLQIKVKRIYEQGVHDGFVQGVEAASK